MLTTSTGNTRSITDRVRRYKDGSVLLSVAEDRICKLNGVGALTWMVLENVQGSFTLDEIVLALEEEFEAINAEGEFHYEVSREQLRADTARFLKKMASMGLLQPLRNSDSQELYSIKDDVSATTSSPEKVDSQHLHRSEEPEENISYSKRETLSAFLGLLAFDLLLKFAGFQSLVKKVEQWPTAEPHTTDHQICRRVRLTVDRAQMYYPKKAMCLQHSAVITCLLRRRGVPAQMVLAAQEFPPKAHAWAEVMNHVVSDSPSVKNKYRELRRL